MNVAKGLLVSVLCLSSGLLAAQNHHSQWKKVYERDLTDFELSPEGSGLVLLAQPQGRCRMDVDFYGETGQDKYRYEFTRDRLTAGSHQEYRYTAASFQYYYKFPYSNFFSNHPIVSPCDSRYLTPQPLFARITVISIS